MRYNASKKRFQTSNGSMTWDGQYGHVEKKYHTSGTPDGDMLLVSVKVSDTCHFFASNSLYRNVSRNTRDVFNELLGKNRVKVEMPDLSEWSVDAGLKEIGKQKKEAAKDLVKKTKKLVKAKAADPELFSDPEDHSPWESYEVKWAERKIDELEEKHMALAILKKHYINLGGAK